MSNAVMAEVWKERFGASYYHFVYQDVLFLALNSELFALVHDPKTQLPGPWKQAEQLAYVERVLRENAGVRWTFVFVHQPLWDVPKQPLPGQLTAPSINADWLKVEQLLGERAYTVFAPRAIVQEPLRGDAGDVTLRATIEPGGVANLELPVRARTPAAYEAIEPAHVRWLLATTGPNGAPLSVETSSIVTPDNGFALKKAARAVVLDADHAEWAPLAFAVRAHGELDGHGDYEGAADASFAFDTRHDEAGVHFAVQVRDDDVVSTPHRTLREQDHVVINLDARPEAARNKNMDYLVARLSGELGKSITAFCGPQQAPERDRVLEMFASTTKITCAARETSEGYALEVSIPRARLDDAAGGDWSATRINITVADFDGEGVNHNTVSWRPSRYGNNATAGSGTFVRQ